MISSISMFLESLNSPNHSIFRGHINENWDLNPTIVRYVDAITNVTNHPVYVSYARALLARFVEEYPFFSNEKLEDYFSIMATAQHYGLPTQLIDWT